MRPMTVADLDAVCQLEAQAYSFPWSRGNFTDSLASGYPAWLLLAAAPQAARRAQRAAPTLQGYYVAMPGVDEAHLLNITVAPAAQGQGHAQHMLAHLAAQAWAAGARLLWLEVREGNARARRLYGFTGFAELGRRKGYYPAGQGQREDAIVMRALLQPPGRLPSPGEAEHALV